MQKQVSELIEKDIAELVVEYTEKIRDLMEKENCKDFNVTLAAFTAPLCSFLRGLTKEQRICSVHLVSKTIISEAPEEERLAISAELFISLSAETAMKSLNSAKAYLSSLAALISVAFLSAPKETRRRAIDTLFEMLRTSEQR